jgi:NAD(P)H-binding
LWRFFQANCYPRNFSFAGRLQRDKKEPKSEQLQPLNKANSSQPTSVILSLPKNMPTILIIGATGTVGRQLVSELLSTNNQIRAAVRKPDSANLPHEIEKIRGDLTVPESLDPALKTSTPYSSSGPLHPPPLQP